METRHTDQRAHYEAEASQSPTVPNLSPAEWIQLREWIGSEWEAWQADHSARVSHGIGSAAAFVGWLEGGCRHYESKSERAMIDAQATDDDWSDLVTDYNRQLSDATQFELDGGF